MFVLRGTPLKFTARGSRIDSARQLRTGGFLLQVPPSHKFKIKHFVVFKLDTLSRAFPFYCSRSEMLLLRGAYNHLNIRLIEGSDTSHVVQLNS